jgi:DNA-binding response OmpR family regulator
VRAGLEAGRHRFLAKPFGAAELVRAADEEIARKRRQVPAPTPG